MGEALFRKWRALMATERKCGCKCRSCILIESIFFAVKEYLFVELVLIQIPRFKPQDGQLVTFSLLAYFVSACCYPFRESLVSNV